MKKAFVWIAIALALITSASAVDFFTDRMNFPSGTSRVHGQSVFVTGNLTITVPSGFNVTQLSAGGAIVGSNVTFSNTTTTSSFNMTSPSTCNESQIFVSSIFQNNVQIGEFRFLCISDDKVVDYKVEYGHGEGNYLDGSELFIPTDQVTLFNLVRIFPLSHVLVPNADIANATINCMFPNKPIRTFGRVELRHDFVNNKVNGTFFWTLIDSGFWFRLGVVSQDTIGLNVGDLYNISCDSLTYSMGTHQVQAPFDNQSIRVVSKTPYLFNAFNDTANPGNLIISVTNNESYITREVEFVFKKSNDTTNVMIPRIDPGDTFFFRVEATRQVNISTFFIPPWFHNSFEDDIYVQQDATVSLNSPPILGPVGNCSLAINETFTKLVNATDPDGDTFSFADNTSLFNINSATGLINFTHNGSTFGNESIRISVTDAFGASDFENIVCELLNTTNTTTPVPTPNATPSAPSGGGGGGKPFGSGSLAIPSIEEPACNERWECGDWGACGIIYEQTRICVDQNACGSIYDRPSTRKDCIPEGALVLNITFEPSCFDGVQNQDEQGIDCGGVCVSCATVQVPAPSCPDNVCLWGELFACKADCALPSFILLLLIFGLFFMPILYFEYHHYKDPKVAHRSMLITLVLYIFITEITYRSVSSITQLSILFWGIIVVLVILISYILHEKEPHRKPKDL
ncbi:MAG: Ig-like domain-containing protein [Candidatus Nanoarchaeia archaeon]